MDERIKNRTIKIDNIVCEGCENTINNALSAIDGIKEVKTDRSGVSVKYDLLKVNMEDILGKIRELKYNTSTGFFQKLKTGFINFTERNERDNLNAPVHSCCSTNCADNANKL